MFNSPLKGLGLLAWIITAVASIKIGLMPFGYDMFSMLQQYPNALLGLHYVIGVAGVVSLVMLFGAGCHKGCSCSGSSSSHM